MFAQARAALSATLIFTLLLGLGYPLAVTGIAHLAFPFQAEGSLVRDSGGRLLGSRLIAQPFIDPAYLHPRPSAAGAAGYDASSSGGSNLGPLNPALADRMRASAQALRDESQGPIPAADAVTTSASGLDPDISPANAFAQAGRVAAARGAPESAVRRVIAGQVVPPALGFLGRPRVNVLMTNIALDAELGRRQPPAR